MNERLSQFKSTIQPWINSGRNYAIDLDWNKLNQLAQDLGNSPFNLGCSSCRADLALFIWDVIKERGV